jgi:hypothetical protein
LTAASGSTRRARLRGALSQILHDGRQELCQLWDFDPVVRRQLLVFLAFQVVNMLWDEPGVYGWENDGPRRAPSSAASSTI